MRSLRSRRSRLFRKIRRMVLASIILLTGLCIYAFKIEPYWLDINPVSVTLPHLSPEFNGYRIAQLSDLHVDEQTPTQYFERVFQTVNQQNPDLVVLTGDFVTDNPEKVADPLITYLTQLEAPSVGVLGNHDHWSQPAVILDAFKRSGVQNLNNSFITIQRGAAQLQIAGVDDVWAGAANLASVLQSMPPQGAALLLAHEPDFADVTASTHRFDLQLSGHAHGGQVTIPGLKPPVLPPLGQRYPVGQYQIDDLIQYTNRGIGMVRPRVRLFSRPEITIFTLLAPDMLPDSSSKT